MKRLPDVVVIGAPKTGTSSLFYALAAHPRIFTPKRKELSYFIEEIHFDRGVEWYKSHFDGMAPDQLGFDISPQYCRGDTYDGVPQRMHALLPDARLLFITRDPIKRIVSEYRHRVSHLKENRTLEDAVLNDPVYVTTSCYHRQMQRFLQVYPRESLLILDSSQTFGETLVVPELWPFLGLEEPDPPLRFENVNPGREMKQPSWWMRRLTKAPGYRRVKLLFSRRSRQKWRQFTGKRMAPERFEMPQDLREELGRRLAPDVQALSDWLGPQHAPWMQDPVYALDGA